MTRKHAELFDSQEWKELKKAHLKEHLLCRKCYKVDIVNSASNVGHRKPHNGDIDLFFDPHNLVSLCDQHYQIYMEG